MSQVDLHLHTTASDGKYSPAELVRLARSAGLKYIAITDHDSIESIPDSIHASQKYGIESIPGVESRGRGRPVRIYLNCSKRMPCREGWVILAMVDQAVELFSVWEAPVIVAMVGVGVQTSDIVQRDVPALGAARAWANGWGRSVRGPDETCEVVRNGFVGIDGEPRIGPGNPLTKGPVIRFGSIRVVGCRLSGLP